MATAPNTSGAGPHTHDRPGAAAAEHPTAAPIGQRIDASYGDLSPQEQRAADFILDNLGDLAVYNAAELARLSGVSKATVSRLFRRLGYSDAQEVRDHARDLRGQGVPIGGITLSSGAVSASIAAHIEQEVANIRRAFAGVSDGRLDAAADLVAGARRVLVVGLRNSYPVALHLRQQLTLGLDDVRLAPQPGQSIGEELAGLGPADCVILIGFRRRPSGFAGVLDAASHRSVPVVLLGDPSARRHAEHSAVFIECPVDGVSPLDSYAAVHSIVTVLAAEALAAGARRPAASTAAPSTAVASAARANSPSTPDANRSRSRIAEISRLYAELDELERSAP